MIELNLVLIFIALIMGIALIGMKALEFFGIWAPLYVQTNQAARRNGYASEQPVAQRPMLTAGHERFSRDMATRIQALPGQGAEKQNLHRFVVDANIALMKLMQSEGVDVALSDIKLGSLTVTYRLRLREFSQSNLNRLMKMSDLIVQALGVESARLLPGAGYIDCELASNVRLPITVESLCRATRGTTVAVGMDTTLRPVTIDVAQHGLITAIAPSRRGKTQAIRTMLYQLKRANPDYNIVIVAFKSQDWQAFSGCATVILDSEELIRFESWLIDYMYKKAKSPDGARWLVVFDDLANLLATNPELQRNLLQFASLGAGVGVTTLVSTQFTGKDSGGVALTANATARLLFKPSSNMQGARDGGMAGLGLDNLSTQKGDALLVVDGDATRIATALTDDALISRLPGNAPDRLWLKEDKPQRRATTTMPSCSVRKADTVAEEVTEDDEHPFAPIVEQLNGFVSRQFDFDEGKFGNRREALRKLGWSDNGRNTKKLAQLEGYIVQNYH